MKYRKRVTIIINDKRKIEITPRTKVKYQHTLSTSTCTVHTASFGEFGTTTNAKLKKVRSSHFDQNQPLTNMKSIFNIHAG